MNCKQGDLAVVVRRSERAPHTLGALVEVMRPAPEGRFRLPDGYYNEGGRAGAGMHWVVRFQRPVNAPLVDGGGSRLTRYGVVPDYALRPLRDNDGEDETLSWAGKPEQVTA